MSEFQSSGNHGFVFRLPQELLVNGPTRMEFRFSTSQRLLEGGVVEPSAADERMHTPFETSDLTGRRVLVLAPHPDDESLTCGGSLILHTQNRDPVKVVYLTDGAQGNLTGEDSDQSYVALRRREAAEACRILGISDIAFWSEPDRGLGVTHEIVERLSSLLDEYRPGLVYAPSPQEFHPDHQATAQLIWRAIERANVETRVAFYESNRPIHINHLVDIGGVIERKRLACNAHRSQLRHHPYTELATALSRYRSLTVAPQVDNAEGFFLLSSSEMRGRPVDWFTVRQHLPMAPSEDSERPLVSVIVRTRDRPALLREALSSILTQTYSNIEVLIVEDGLTEGSRESVCAVATEFERFFPVRVIRPEAPIGRAAAATLGAKKALGKYLNFLDDDDLLYSGHLSRLVGFLETTGERIVYSDCEQCRYEWRDGALQPLGERTPFFGLDYDRDRLYFHNYIPFITAMFQRGLAEEVGYFDEGLHVLEDWDFWIRASARTDFHRLPGATALYRRFINRDRAYEKQMERVHRKHADDWEKLAVSARDRIRTLQDENAKLAETLSAMRAELRDTSGNLSWQWLQSLKWLGLEPLVNEEAWKDGPGPSESFDGWRKRASSPWRVIEALREQNAKLRSAAGTIEREIRTIRRTPYWQAIHALPKPLLHATRRLFRRFERSRQPAIDEKTKLDVRTYREGDEKQILALFQVCFGAERGLDHWRWKYLDHPWGTCKIVVASTDDGQLLAHYAGYPAHFYDAAGFEPRTMLGLQIGDTMTSPAARHVGRRRTNLLRRVMESHFEEFCEGQVDLNFGFNTGKIQRYYLRLVEGSRFFEDAPFMVLDLSRPIPDGRREEYLIRRINTGADEVANALDAFFYRVAPRYGLLTQRDGSYVQWRYLQCPDVDYSLYVAYHGDSLVGWSVFRQQDERLIWGDGLFDREHSAAFAATLRHAVSQPAHRGTSTLR